MMVGRVCAHLLYFCVFWYCKKSQMSNWTGKYKNSSFYLGLSEWIYVHYLNIGFCFDDTTNTYSWKFQNHKLFSAFFLLWLTRFVPTFLSLASKRTYACLNHQSYVERGDKMHNYEDESQSIPPRMYSVIIFE